MSLNGEQDFESFPEMRLPSANFIGASRASLCTDRPDVRLQPNSESERKRYLAKLGGVHVRLTMDGSLPSFEDRLAYIRSTHELADQIVELAGHLNAGNYRFLALIAEFDRRKGWNCRATQDCAHWLNIWTPPALQARIRFWNWKTAQIYPAS